MKQRLSTGIQKTPTGQFFGVPWVIEYVDARALSRLIPLYRAIRSKPHQRASAGTALGGSAAYMGENNPYPADVDFTEIVLVRASDPWDAALRCAFHLQEDIERITAGGNFRFLELKAGKNPHTGKGLKWEFSEARRGCKVLNQRRGDPPKTIQLHEALLQRQMVKLDLIGTLDGIYREITKVYRFAFRKWWALSGGNIELLTPENLNETIYQEVYFNRKAARLSALLSEAGNEGGYNNPRVMMNYRHVMDVEIAHYGALGMVEKMSHLKLLKRWFNKLRMDHNRESASKIITLLQSEVNRANALKEALKLLGQCIERHLLTKTEILEQLVICEAELKASRLLERTGQIPGTLSQVMEDITQNRLGEGLKGIASCVRHMERWIEDRVRQYLVEEILMPSAQGLGITSQRGRNIQAGTLFGGITGGEKIHYLVYRYLMKDPRVRVRSFQPGEYIVRFGERAGSCFILIGGTASVALGENPEEMQVVREVNPFTIIGEIGLIHQGGIRTASVRASTDLQTLEIPHLVFSELMRDSGFRLFVEFLCTDRLLEDRARAVNQDPIPQEQPPV
jgi:CRP-like cAMP-binding protein